MHNLYILCSGRSQRFKDANYEVPKPLLPIMDITIFESSLIALKKMHDWSKIYVVIQKNHATEFKLDIRILEIDPNVEIIYLQNFTKGPLESAFLALQQTNETNRFTIADCDQAFEGPTLLQAWGPSLEGIVPLFKSNKSHFSYAITAKEILTDIKEKHTVSNNAIAGVYSFNNSILFRKEAKIIIDNHQGELYMSLYLKKLLESKFLVATRLLDWHVSYGTPEELKSAHDNLQLKKLLGKIE
jgi:dTDP-glucose pyrophosphorylase